MKSYLKLNVCKIGDRELPHLVILIIIYEFIIFLITNNDFLIKVNEIKSSFRKCRGKNFDFQLTFTYGIL